MELATRKDDRSSSDFFSDMEDDDVGEVGAERVGKKPSRFEKRMPTDRAETLYSERCRKCGGTGTYRGNSNYGSECFACNGKGVLTFKTPKAVRDANKIKSAQRKERKLEENLAKVESEYPAIAAWWKDSTFQFAIDLREKARKFGSLTPGQITAALKCAQKFGDAQKALELQREAQVTAAAPVNIQPILNAFARAKSKGLRFPKMYLLGGAVKLCFSRAPDHGKNAGAVYVKHSTNDGTYLGKIADGKFFASRECDDDMKHAVEAACADPENSAIAFGKKFGVCSCCGRDLTDPDSVARGIGSVCADNFFG